MTPRHDVAEVYRAEDGWRYRIKAGNGEVIASGEGYTHRGDVIDMLDSHFPSATIVEIGAEDDGA